MFKLAVLCALLAAATADPSTIISPLSYSNVLASPPVLLANRPSSLVYSSPAIATAPLTYSSPYGFAHLIKKRSLAVGIAPSTYISSAPLLNTYAAPIVTSYAAPLAASYAAPIATTYSSPYGLAHLIKKRSLALGSYSVPTTYVSSAPLINTYTTPLVTSYAASIAAPLATTYSAPLYSAAHLIKKRSAFLTPSTYVAPISYAAATPYVASTYAAPLISTPLVSSAPIAYSHLIKKRSAPILAYSAPASFSHQSRFDFQATSPAVTTYTSYTAPSIYSAQVGVSHLI